jgi:hypothetical protein
MPTRSSIIFSRVAVRLNRLLHYQPSGYKKYVRWPNAGGRLGVELAFALTTVFLGVLFLLSCAWRETPAITTTCYAPSADWFFSWRFR